MASEIIYNVENYDKIAKVLIQCLKPEGMCLLASKLYYFGVGGNLMEFKDFI